MSESPSPPPLPETVARLAVQGSEPPRRAIPAWLLSFAIHTLLLLALAFLFRSVSRGAAEEDNRSGGIVLVNLDSRQTEYLSEGETDLAAEAAAQAAAAPTATTVSELPPELPGLSVSEQALAGVGNDFSETLPGAEGMLELSQSTGKLGGEVTTEVFGVKGTGTRFVYVFDRSASMEGYNARPLLAAKQQLLQSLQSLGDLHQFQIIFYNDETSVFDPNPGEPEMLFASDEIKRKAERFVGSVRGDRGTNHLKALRAALALGPDVVFLLTDAEGGFTPAELNEISRWNRSAAVINTIEFGAGSGPGRDRSLERLARENRGQYSYKDIRTLRLD